MNLGRMENVLKSSKQTRMWRNEAVAEATELKKIFQRTQAESLYIDTIATAKAKYGA